MFPDLALLGIYLYTPPTLAGWHPCGMPLQGAALHSFQCAKSREDHHLDWDARLWNLWNNALDTQEVEKFHDPRVTEAQGPLKIAHSFLTSWCTGFWDWPQYSPGAGPHDQTIDVPSSGTTLGSWTGSGVVSELICLSCCLVPAPGPHCFISGF